MKKIKKITFLSVIFLISIGSVYRCNISGEKTSIVFASYIVADFQFKQTLNLCESLRTFGGILKNTPIRVYVNERLKEKCKDYEQQFQKLQIEIRFKNMPAEAYNYFLGFKPHIASQAEKDAENEFDLVVILDANILILDEPTDFLLAKDKSLAYRPVMHQNIGLLYDEEPNEFWENVYRKTEVNKSAFFPMKTIADNKILKPYFNAGLLVTRPEKKVFRSWENYFNRLANDANMIETCKEQKYNIFLHQAALVGSVLNNIPQKELVLLPFSYNYPIFFEKFYGSELDFDSIKGVVSIKYEFNFNQLPDDWATKLKGHESVINWMKKKLDQ